MAIVRTIGWVTSWTVGKLRRLYSNSILLNTLIHVVDGPRLLVGRGPGYEARMMDA